MHPQVPSSEDNDRWSRISSRPSSIEEDGLDIILGMDWLRKHQSTISCSDRAVTLINHKGLKVECHPQTPKVEPIVCSMQAASVEEVLVICEYPGVFPEELP
jgi:hypothetical protein